MTHTTRGITLAAAAALLAGCNKKDATAPITVGTIQGLVVDTGGFVMDQASVRLRNLGGVIDLQAALTDATGKYTFSNVPAGSYDVFLVIPAATAVSGGNTKSAAVAANGSTQLNFVVTLIPVSFSVHVQPVFTGQCTGCHSAAFGVPPMGLKLTPDSAYELTVGFTALELPAMKRIKATLPDSSYLIHKVQGTHLTAGGSGAQMPLGIPPLAAQTIRMLRRWIKEGALKN
jgi:hypothetical protein